MSVRAKSRRILASLAEPCRRAALAVGAVLLVVIASLSACGGGGGGGGADQGGGQTSGIPLRVVRTTPPIFQLGYPAAWWITGAGGTPPYAFTVLPGQGSPPPGLEILVSGKVSGTPLVEGSSAFVVQVTDSAKPSSTAMAQIVLAVGGFDVVIDGLSTPDPWVGTAYRMWSPSGSLPVTFEIVRSAGGSSFVDADPAAHASTYVTGPVTGEDLLRVARSNGEWTELVLEVGVDPAPNRTAHFGATDVWFVRFSGKEDASHGFASDFDRALFAMGLRAPTSVDPRGSDAELFAKYYVQQKTLSRLDELFLNFPDGTPAPAGLSISLPSEVPPFPYAAPPDGTAGPAAPGAFNTIAVIAGVDDAFLFGASFQDDLSNGRVESVLPSGLGAHRGVFVDGLVAELGPAFFSASLSATPLAAADVPALRALAYGLANPGGRYLEIRRVADGFANVLAIRIAYEIGRCVGLGPSGTGGLMAFDEAWLLTPGASPTFSASDVAALRVALPGDGR